MEIHQEAATAEALFGAAMRRAREIRRLSQQDVADRMQDKGFSWRQSTVAKTEAAERPIRLNEAVAVGEVLQVRLAEMLREFHAEEAVALRAVIEAQAQLNRLENERREMSNEMRRRADSIKDQKMRIERLMKELKAATPEQPADAEVDG